MTEPLHVEQFAIVEREPVDRGPNAGIFTGKGPADDRAELFMLAEGTTPAGDAFAGHIVTAAGQAFATLDMSLTGAVRRIFADAARSLADWNAKSIAQHRVDLGITALARRGDQAVFAQAGPAVAFHRSRRGLTVYYPDQAHSAALGAAEIPEPQLLRVEIAPGDRLLLLTTNAMQALDDELIDGILRLPTDQVLRNVFRRLQGQRNTTVIFLANPVAPQLARRPASVDSVIDATGPAARALVAAAPKPPPVEASYQPSLFIEPTAEDAIELVRRQLVEIRARREETVALAPVMRLESVAPLRRAAGENTLARLAAERRARAAVAQSTIHAGYRGPAWRPPPTPEGPASDSIRRRRAESFSLGLVRDDVPALPAPNLDGAPLVHELADDRRTRSAALGAVAEAIAGENAAVVTTGGMLIRVRENPSGRMKGSGVLDSGGGGLLGKLPPTWLIIAAGLSALLVIVGIVAIPRIISSQDDLRLAQLVDQAQRQLATAQVVQDPAERRAALTDAQGLLLEARQRDGSQVVADLLKEATEAIAAMDAIVAPAKVETLADLTQFGEKPVAAARLTIGTDAAFILDGNSGQIISVPLTGAERRIVYTEDKDTKRAKPAAMVWVDGDDLGEPSLLIVDVASAFWAYSPSLGLRSVPVGGPAGMEVTDIAMFGRDLYVLDAAHGAVYRLNPGRSAYVAPFRALETPDLSAARRLTVNGEIVTADEGGRIRRFSGTLSLILSEAGIDKRLSVAATPFPLSTNGDLAVLDAANDRIAVFRRDGVFDRQYKSKDLTEIGAFTVSEGVPYVFSGGKLRRITW